ncbi:MAG TPA: hypothetical protein PKD59_15400 [Miltoncostaeaceae bacterium]|nr:hypothetical protein [Miltoncostaeaceae bacterium]
MPRTDTRFAAVALSIAATLAIAAPAAARSTLFDDDAPTLRRALAAGLQTSADNVWQMRTAEPVLGAGREVEPVPASALLGRGAGGMAAVLRKAVAASGGHYAVIEDLGPAFRGTEGDALAAAFGTLSSQASPYIGGGVLARRVHVYFAADAGPLLADPEAAGLRTAASRAGGVWLKTTGWSRADWLTWPSEAARQAAARGPGRTNAHVAMVAGDQTSQWAAARSGSACVVLANGPGAYRVGGGIDDFVAEYRRTFPSMTSKKRPTTGCTAAPVLPAAGASALVAAAGRETTGLPIPPGGLVTPPLVAGEPAQVTLQLGPDPLGLAAALGLSPEQAWDALDVVVEVRGPGVALDVPVAGDGSAALEFTPTAPGPVSMRIVLGAAGLATALGGPADMVASLAAAPGGSAMLARVVADPDAWSLSISLVPTGGSVGDPVLVIVPPVV